MGEYRNAVARDASPLLIAAVTGRALAASAARGGYPVVVLDLFADRDTRSLARRAEAVMAPGGFRFDRPALLRAAARFAPRSGSAGLVYGAGFEGRPGLLARLAAGRELLGNPVRVLAAMRDPRQFFPLLGRLGIRHPEIRFRRPDDVAGWLVKNPGTAGGTQVRRATRRAIRAGCYYQRFEQGQARSVLFLADGRRASVVGFNRQWVRPVHADRPFLYGGAVGAERPPASVTSDINDRLHALVEAAGLVGLNGLDFLLDGDRWLVLELNPRPTATAELYDPDYPEGLLHLHIQACRGSLPSAGAAPAAARAHAIVHAPAAWEVTASFRFPMWCRDVPMPGTTMAPGHPVCTVHAEAASPELAAALVEERRVMLEQALAAEAVMVVGV
jgi:predicted ATP-grasp superfamily ATP-dependent carboligase